MFGNAPPARTIPSAFALGLIIAETVQWIRLDLARLFDPLAHDCQQAMPLRKNPVLALKRCLLCRGREKIEYGRPCPVTDNPTHDLSPPGTKVRQSAACCRVLRRVASAPPRSLATHHEPDREHGARSRWTRTGVLRATCAEARSFAPARADFSRARKRIPAFERQRTMKHPERAAAAAIVPSFP